MKLRPARSHPAFPALLAAAVGFLLFAHTLRGGFAYDFYGIKRNDTRLAEPSTWGTFWTQSYNGGVDNLYRPLTSTLLGVQSWVFGLDESDAWKFHLINLLMHAGVCACVAELCRRWVDARVGLIAGLLYAVHPIHVEVICDIVGQAEMMCALGTLGAMILFAHKPMTFARAGAIFGCFILAVLSKEQGMLLPALLLMMWCCQRWPAIRVSPVAATPASPVAGGDARIKATGDTSVAHPQTREKQAMQFLIILLCFGLGAYVVVRENFLKLKFWWDRSFLDPAINPMIDSHGMDRLLVPLALLGRYTQLLIFPWKLAPDYSGVAIGSTARLDDPYLWFGAFVLVVWFAMLGIAIVRRAGVMLMCLLGIAITYGLVANLVTIIGTNFAERLMYLPSVFFVIVIAIGLAKLRNRAMVSLLITMILLASVRSFTYAQRWNDRLVLYEGAVHDQPGAIRMYLALSYEYYERGEGECAVKTLETARQIMPEYAHLWTFSAALAIEMNDLESAEKFLKNAQSIDLSMNAINLEEKLKNKRAATQQAAPSSTQKSPSPRAGAQP